MSHIGTIGGGASASGVPRPRQVERNDQSGPQTRSQSVRRGEDRVEVSDLAHSLARASKNAPIRQDLVDRVRSQIDAGTYITPSRIDGAVNAIMRGLGSDT